MFFIISGFIFFHLYEWKIRQGSMRPYAFAVLRFSRLYPLHFATLVVVAILQFLFFGHTGQYFVYPANDPLHFVASLAFVQLINDQAAFNGPTWSLTIEILMYGLFYLLARRGYLAGFGGAFAAFCLGIGLVALSDSLAQGLLGFFGGGLVYRLYCRTKASTNPHFWFLVVLLGVAAGWLIVGAFIYSDNALDVIFLPLKYGRHIIPNLLVTCGLFPLTVLMCALHEHIYKLKYTGFVWLGNISYSSYLIHFPMQLCVAIAFYLDIVSLDTIRSSIMFLTFFGGLIVLSTLVYAKFELPAQTRLRKILM
jgi:peptidoglycan/LPS O-acetylase OafA/YrhL